MRAKFLKIGRISHFLVAIVLPLSLVLSMAMSGLAFGNPPEVTVTLQGGERPNPDGFDVPLTLKLYSTSPEITTANILDYWDEPLYEYTTADEEIEITYIDEETGTITLSVDWDCSDGTYQVLLYSPHSLVGKRNNVVINQSQSTFSMGTLMEGDAVDITEESLTIDVTDFTAWAGAYEAEPEDPNWDERTDFDRDLFVGTLDYSLLYSNYGLTSPQTVAQEKSLASIPVQKIVDITLGIPEQPVTVDDEFEVTIDVDAGEQPVAAVAAYITFDPDCLEVVSITPDETMALVLSNAYNNVTGKLKLTAGRELGTEPASGSFTLGTIVFSAKAASPGTALAFEYDCPLRNTNAVYAGDTAFRSATDAEIKIILPLTVDVTLQGGERPYPDGYEVPLTLKLYNTSPEITFSNILQCWNQPLYEYTTADGEIEITDIDLQTGTITFSVACDAPSGTYQVLLYSPSNLVNKRNNLAINPSQYTFTMGTLKEGDAVDVTQNSLTIDVTDFTTWAGTYEAEPEDPNWDERANYDRDLFVGTVDFSLLHPNYGLTSPQTVVLDKFLGSALIQGTVNIALGIPEAPVMVNGEFEVTIDVEAGEQDIAAIAAYISFDPDCLEVVSITPGEILDAEFSNSYNNVTGKLKLTAGVSLGSDPASGSFTLGTIMFSAKSASPAAALTFEHAIPRQTEAAYEGNSVLGTATDNEVQIILPVTVDATLQGSSRPYPAGYQVPLSLKLYDTSPEITFSNILDYWNEPLYEYTTADEEIEITDINSETKTITFTVNCDAPSGTYQVLLYSPQNLVNRRSSVDINPSESSFTMGTLLEGDTKDITEGSKTIDVTDYSIWAAAYGSTGGPPPSGNWNPKADFDRNNYVAIADYSLLYTNYGKTSPQTVSGEKAMGEQVTGKVDLSITAPEKDAVEGSSFTVAIEVDATSQPLTALAAYLSFDPAYLEVVSVKPGETLDVVFANAFDNEKGTISLGIGRDFKLDPASGKFTAVTIEFRAKKATDGTAIVFEHKPPRETDVAFAGYSVLGTATDGKIVILTK